jgi:hypothetical protein
MYPKNTEYKIASTYDEYVDCHKLLKEDEELSYPTVMAVRDGKTIGMMSTAKGDENLFATPLIAKSVFVCIGLYELYEQTLKNLGVTHYLFNIEKDNTKMINVIERFFEIKPYIEIDNLLWYVRRL